MQRLLITLIALTLGLTNAIGQEIIKAVRQINNSQPLTTIDSFYNLLPNTIFVSLYEGFDDSTFIFINDSYIYKGYLKSNESIGHTGLQIPIGFKDTSSILTLTIRFKKTGQIIQEKLNLNYKLLQVRGLKQWLLIYTNHFPMLE